MIWELYYATELSNWIHIRQNAVNLWYHEAADITESQYSDNRQCGKDQLRSFLGWGYRRKADGILGRYRTSHRLWQPDIQPGFGYVQRHNSSYISYGHLSRSCLFREEVNEKEIEIGCFFKQPIDLRK